MRIEPADQLSSLSLEQALTFLSLHKNENIVFDVTSGAEIFAVNEDTLRPLDAIDLEIGANLIGKKISVDGYGQMGLFQILRIRFHKWSYFGGGFYQG